MFRVKPEVVAARPSAFAALYRSEDVMVKVLGVNRKPAPRRKESLGELERRSQRLLTDCLVAVDLEVRQCYDITAILQCRAVMER